LALRTTRKGFLRFILGGCCCCGCTSDTSFIVYLYLPLVLSLSLLLFSLRLPCFSRLKLISLWFFLPLSVTQQFLGPIVYHWSFAVVIQCTIL
jgi:hypothetical protein